MDLARGKHEKYPRDFNQLMHINTLIYGEIHVDFSWIKRVFHHRKPLHWWISWGYNREIHVDFSSISRDFCAWVWFSPYFIKPTTALFRFYPINVSSCKCYYSCSVEYHPFVSYQFLGCIILHPRGLILYYHDIMLSIPISIYTEYVYNLPFRV